MLRFIKGNLEKIDGVEIFPIISLVIFFIFFVGLFLWVVTMKKSYVKEVSNLPLENDQNNQSL